MKFGDNLRNLRKQIRISQEELAEKVGVSRQSVSKWETSEAYPEMNNILQLCKIFHCHINDLVHEDMSDIDSLDEEIKMSIVKFKEEQQKKMKAVSKAICVVSKIGQIICIIGVIAAIIAMISLPFLIKNVTVAGDTIRIKNAVINNMNTEDISKIVNVFETYSTTKITLCGEYTIICLELCVAIYIIILRLLEKLFNNIHNGDTPFTLENVASIKKLAKYLIISIIFPIVSGFIMQILINTDMGIEIEVFHIILVLIIYAISYIFKYGYELQKDSKGVMYGKD